MVRGTVRVSKRPAKMRARLSVSGLASDAAADVTDLMLQGGGTETGWVPHLHEMMTATGGDVSPELEARVGDLESGQSVLTDRMSSVESEVGSAKDTADSALSAAQNAQSDVQDALDQLADIVNNFMPVTQLGTEHLDTVRDTGVYIQASNANASSSNGYPSGLEAAGELRVVTLIYGWCLQVFTHYSGESARRYRGNSGWNDWVYVQTQGHITDFVETYVTDAVSGLTSTSDVESMIDGALEPLTNRIESTLEVRDLGTQNLNDLMDNAIWIQTSNGSATSARNYPPGLLNAGTLKVYELTGSWRMQVYFELNGGIAIRRRSSTSWGSWSVIEL